MNIQSHRCYQKSLLVNDDHARRGAAMILFVAMIFAFVAVAAITVDYSYMQLVRTELRAATDAAAKAGAETLARTEDVDEARDEAIRYAAANRVGGQPFLLNPNDVVFGRVTPQSSGNWAFSSGGDTLNAVRINARTGGNAAHSAVPLFFSRVLGRDNFSPSYTATAGQQEVEVCLCLDRSGSMLFDMTGVDYAYAPNNPNLSSFTAWGTTWQNHLSPPHPTASRWAVLRDAVNLFLTEAGNYNPPPRTALVTWGTDYTMPIAPSTVFRASTTDIALPASSSHNWNGNMTSLQNAIQSLGNQPMMGGTNLSSGLDRAVSVLRGTNSSLYTSKVIILLTDGQWNAGRDPELAAYDARGQGITVHCISMLTNSQSDLQSVATITGGKYIQTTNTQQLRDAFVELAHSLPVVLTD
jgi:Ca-activated chloride channel homolog